MKVVSLADSARVDGIEEHVLQAAKKFVAASDQVHRPDDRRQRCLAQQARQYIAVGVAERSHLVNDRGQFVGVLAQGVPEQR